MIEIVRAINVMKDRKMKALLIQNIPGYVSPEHFCAFVSDVALFVVDVKSNSQLCIFFFISYLVNFTQRLHFLLHIVQVLQMN